MKYQVGNKVKYIGKRNRRIRNQIGVVSATKLDNWQGIKLRCDEYLVDFGFEEDYEYVIREPQLAEGEQSR